MYFLVTGVNPCRSHCNLKNNLYNSITVKKEIVSCKDLSFTVYADIRLEFCRCGF